MEYTFIVLGLIATGIEYDVYDILVDVTTTSAGAPSSPLEPTAPIVATDFLTLSWRPPEDSGHSDIVNYSIRWQEPANAR